MTSGPGRDRRGNTQVLAAVGMALLAVVASLVVAVVVFDVTNVDERFLGEEPPQTSFDFAYDNQSRVLEVTHASGDPIDGDRVVFEYNGQVIRTWERESRVQAGESIVLYGIDRWATVNVTWKNGDGDRVTLSSWTGETGS